jgi:broad specificity phosphatase PhoE
MAEAPASAAPAEAEAPVGPRFFFIRHGEGEHNALIAAGHKAEGRGVLDPKLTEAGRAQR